MTQEQKLLKIKDLECKLAQLKIMINDTTDTTKLLCYQIQVDGIMEEIEELRECT